MLVSFCTLCQQGWGLEGSGGCFNLHPWPKVMHVICSWTHEVIFKNSSKLNTTSVGEFEWVLLLYKWLVLVSHLGTIIWGFFPSGTKCSSTGSTFGSASFIHLWHEFTSTVAGEHYCDPNNHWNCPGTLAMFETSPGSTTHDHHLMECGL
jgi:hypothetical protein